MIEYNNNKEHKTVPEDSEEAKKYLSGQEKTKNDSIKTNNDDNKGQSKTENNFATISSDIKDNLVSSSSATPISNKKSSNPIQKQKPKSQLNSILKSRDKFGRPKSKLINSLNKKPTKLNTLEKSKMDWNKFTNNEGIVDELKYHNKNGYVEKQEFLQRAYDKQVEDIKSLRQATRKQ
ncbi:10713_t:CDS:2 [Entrophospora sp. SA101]|nr:682_t:CDS:2 [Entrophospora candida]CAH1761298.1 13359_t:CDS:2 [Entrophospora sp. SA101]CAG8546362.1 11075_t:CDS:2 [Entrophospora candida]CAJ0637785.1 8085_t:CDS:2 [Entrophospora sp. SA101]CAJ0752082.1 10713_t:CDS:2 [Entrophospora sp. SA101]